MNTEKRIFFIRHGQSDGNAKGYAQTANTPLSPLGKTQAQLLAPRMAQEVDKGIPLTFITSGMTRAIETGECIQSALIGHGMEFCSFAHPVLNEIRRASHVIGRSGQESDVKEYYTLSAIGFQEGAPARHDDEGVSDLFARATLASEYLLSHTTPQLIVVGHGAFLSVLIDHLIFGEVLTPRIFARTHYHLRNASLTVLDYSKRNTWKSHQMWRWEISLLGDTSHLKDLPSSD